MGLFLLYLRKKVFSLKKRKMSSFQVLSLTHSQLCSGISNLGLISATAGIT